MKISDLYKACEEFEKRAQQKIQIDPSKKNIDFWSRFLYNTLGSYSQYLRAPQDAKRVFDAVSNHIKSPAYTVDTDAKYVDMLLTSLEEASSKLQQAGVNPIDALKQKGMSNLNPGMLDVLKKNLETLRDGKDFSQYQHFYLPRHGDVHPKDVIEIDEPIKDKNGPGY